MKRYYSFAGVGLAFDLPDGEEFSEGRELPVFACEPRAGMTDVTVRIADRLIMPEGKIRAALPNMTEYDCGDAIVRCFGALSDGADNAGIIAEYRESGIRITMKRSVYRKITASAVLETIGTERLVGMAGGAILHSSFIEVGGKAVLFTAPSGTGKSTQAELWRENRGAVVINGDRSVLRIIDSVPCASGLPYSGSSGICLNRTLPLRAIVYIEQAHGELCYPPARICGIQKGLGGRLRQHMGHRSGFPRVRHRPENRDLCSRLSPEMHPRPPRGGGA